MKNQPVDSSIKNELFKLNQSLNIEGINIIFNRKGVKKILIETQSEEIKNNIEIQKELEELASILDISLDETKDIFIKSSGNYKDIIALYNDPTKINYEFNYMQDKIIETEDERLLGDLRSKFGFNKINQRKKFLLNYIEYFSTFNFK